MKTTTNLKSDFLDILSDLEEGTHPNVILSAFEAAICEWMQYHEDAVLKYRDLHGRFLTGRTFP